MKKISKPKLLIFDVNETLLDLTKVKNAVNQLFGNEIVFSLWFSTLLQYSMTESICGSYHSFGEIGKATLKMIASQLDVQIEEKDVEDTLSLIRTLPAHLDVEPSLRTFKKDGLQLVALTNGSKDTVKAQMQYAELTAYFDYLFSVEDVNSFKPQAKTYEYVLKQVGRNAEDCMLIAAHPWDIAGAKAVGMQTAYIQRKGKPYYPLLEDADFMVSDLGELSLALK